MKRFFALSFAAIALLFACGPEENNPAGTDGPGGKDNTVHVTGISLDRNSATIKEGEYITLVATVTPSNADNKSVSWSSSSDAVATVDASGKVTGVKAGSATITATAADGGMKASCALSVEANLAPSVTVEAKNVSAISAVLAGKANLGSTVASDLKVGFQYSESAGILPSNSTTIEATDADASYNYTAAITGLDPETKYYFRSFVRQNGQDTYGETKEFTTKALSSMLHTKEATSVSAVSACLNATLDLTDVRYESKSLGFYWGSSAESVNTKLTSPEGSNSISADLLSLTPSKEYYFRAYIVLDGKEYKEEVVSFTTKDIESILGTLDATGIEATKASLNAKLDLSDVKYSSISYGFYWGASESSQNNGLSGGEIKDNAYSAPLTGLSHKTQYWYKAYVKLDSQTFYGEVKTFTTDVVPVESVSLDKTEYTFHTIGSTLTLNATVLPSDATDKSIEWTSDNEKVATVDANGRLMAMDNGTATISVTTKDQGKTATCTITVAQWVTGLSLNKTSITLNEGEEDTLVPTITPSNVVDKSLTWTSSNTSVAIVDEGGKVKAVSKGTATIKAEASDGSGKYATCPVTVKRLVSAITLDKTSMVLYRGTSDMTGSITTTVTPADASNTAVTWTSSNTSVATVSSSGVVTGKSSGMATITVSAQDGSGIKATCEVAVRQYVTGISLDKPSLSLVEGESYTLAAAINPANASDSSINWTSSDTAVAIVNAEGKVTAISKGSATIKAIANDGSGVYTSCSVMVKRLISSIELNKTSLVLYRGTSNATETLTVAVKPFDASNTAVTWTSSNTSVATVSSSGVVTGKSSGMATITVSAQDGSGIKATCEVAVRQYVTGITLDRAYLSIAIGEEAKLSVVGVLPDNAYDKTYTWSSSDNAIAFVDNSGIITAISKGSATIKAIANDGSGVYTSCSVIVFEGKVDMGIKTSDGKTLYWSSRNLCANGFVREREGYGDYYAWGETETKSDYSWSTYKWGTNATTFSKYNTDSSRGIVDNKTVLDPEDDVAHIKLGSKWRMPTDAEWTELRTQCTWTWTDNYNGTGVAGRIVTASNGNSIFLPAAGNRDGTRLNNAGSYGYYWSSSLNTDGVPGAWNVSFYSGGVYKHPYGNYRYYGYSVRPVSE